MRRGVAWLTQALAVALLAWATTAQAQVSQIAFRFQSYHVPERSTGFWGHSVTVELLTGPPLNTDVTVDWSLVAGSATATPGNDYVMANGTLTFTAGTESSETILVQINGDTIDEWTLPLTFHQDEVFFIQLSNPSANAIIDKGLTTITLIDDDRPAPGVQFLAALSAGDAVNGYNKLHWREPGAQVPPTDVLIRWNTGTSGCASPSTPFSGLSGPGSGQAYYVGGPYLMAGPGSVHVWPHLGLPHDLTYCYSLFAVYGATPTSEGAQVTAVPFNATGRIAWRYHTGAASVVPPTVGMDAIYTVDNLGIVHAMQRGPTGGAWPSLWNPVAVGKPTQSRSAVVPFLGGWRLFLGTDGGGVHAVDGRQGNVIWSRSAAFTNALPALTTGTTQAQPAGLFKAWGGNNDMLLVGTNNGVGNNAFFALNPATGVDIAGYPDATMGNVTGMAVVDYAAPNRVYFGTSEPGATFFALDLGPAGAPGLTLSPIAWNRKPMGTGTFGAPVLRGRTVYLGDSAGEVHTLHLSDGTSYACPTSDGPVKGFVWPDRRDDRLYFSTNGKVHGFRDPGAAAPFFIWSTDVTTPSMVLQKPGSDFLYVGDGNGNLVQIDVLNPSSPTLQPLEGIGVQIGAPSLDGGFGLVLVGSSKGTIHAVRVPF